MAKADEGKEKDEEKVVSEGDAKLTDIPSQIPPPLSHRGYPAR